LGPVVRVVLVVVPQQTWSLPPHSEQRPLLHTPPAAPGAVEVVVPQGWPGPTHTPAKQQAPALQPPLAQQGWPGLPQGMHWRTLGLQITSGAEQTPAAGCEGSTGMPWASRAREQQGSPAPPQRAHTWDEVQAEPALVHSELLQQVCPSPPQLPHEPALHMPVMGEQLPPLATQRPPTQQPPSPQALPAQQGPPAWPQASPPSAPIWSTAGPSPGAGPSPPSRAPPASVPGATSAGRPSPPSPAPPSPSSQPTATTRATKMGRTLMALQVSFLCRERQSPRRRAQPAV
jgi:hypothetical protein